MYLKGSMMTKKTANELFKIKAGKAVSLSDKAAAQTPLLSGEDERDDAKLTKLASKINELQDLLWSNQSQRLLLVLQGTDTSGKDGTARFVFANTSPLGVKVAAFKAPTEEERSRDYVWRVHQVVPRAGEIVIFNRSHYEDVLVPWVSKWIDKDELKRRYAHINAFEKLLCDTGTTVLKVMLHISFEEQRERLQERIDDTSKHWKFSLGDLETRKHWTEYTHAYEKMMQATGTNYAPWHVVPSDSKTHRNIAIAELVIDALKAMKLKAPKAKPELKGLVVT
jgi:PPK2 family polyphosphate:nucleotide phosphotransferase